MKEDRLKIIFPKGAEDKSKFVVENFHYVAVTYAEQSSRIARVLRIKEKGLFFFFCGFFLYSIRPTIIQQLFHHQFSIRL